MGTFADMPTRSETRLFDAMEVTIAFAVVDAATLDAIPEAPAPGSARRSNNVVSWSPGLVAHQWVLHARGSARRLPVLHRRLARALGDTVPHLTAKGLRLLPGGGHPWMAPHAARITAPQAALADRILGARTHGHAHGQGLYLIFPFTGDLEFTRLFSAVRMLLPVIPALTAASPVVDGAPNHVLDNRLLPVDPAQARVPALARPAVPEAAFTEEDYYRIIKAPLAQALAEEGALDLLGHDRTDPRLAVASFDPGTLQLRVADAQESVAANMAVVEMITAVLRALVKGRWVSTYLQRAWHEQDLEQVLMATIRHGDAAEITDLNYMVMFGLMGHEGISAGKLWQHLFVELYGDLSDNARTHIAHILEHGCLARRILDRTGPTPDRAQLRAVYAELADHLLVEQPFA